MNRHAKGAIALLALSGLFAGCQGKAPASEVAVQADEPSAPVYESPGKPQFVPVNLKYRLLEVPQVGRPFEVELTIESSVDTAALSYSIAADTGLVVDVQGATMSASSKPAHEPETRIVRFTPMAEGRYHVNVNCNVMVNGQMMSRVIPIAIQVGQGRRQLEQMGELGQDAEGNPIVSLPASTNDDDN